MINLLPVAYSPSVKHPAWAERFDLWALGDPFETPGDALRRMAWLRDNGRNTVIPEGYALGFLRPAGHR